MSDESKAEDSRVVFKCTHCITYYDNYDPNSLASPNNITRHLWDFHYEIILEWLNSHTEEMPLTNKMVKFK